MVKNQPPPSFRSRSDSWRKPLAEIVTELTAKEMRRVKRETKQRRTEIQRVITEISGQIHGFRGRCGKRVKQLLATRGRLTRELKRLESWISNNLAELHTA